MESYYNLLNIGEDASQEEIKKAYAKLIRRFHPEKDAENFKKIREAYEILSDPDKRKEYDFQIKYGDEYLNHLQDAEYLIEVGEYEGAREILKRLALIKPEDEGIWRILTDTYIKENDFNGAIEVLEKALKYNSKSALLLFLAGLYYKEIKNYARAESYFKKALEIEKDYIIYEGLFYLYLNSEKYKEAENIIEEMENELVNDIEKIQYNILAIKHKILMSMDIYDCQRDTEKFINNIVDICSSNEEVKKFTVNEIMEDLEFFAENEWLLEMYIFWKIMFYLLPQDEKVKENYNFIKEKLFSSQNDNRQYHTSNINCNTDDILDTDPELDIPSQNNTSAKDDEIIIDDEKNNDSTHVKNSSDNDGCGCLVLLILLIILGNLGPVGIFIFIIILYFAMKD